MNISRIFIFKGNAFVPLPSRPFAAQINYRTSGCRLSLPRGCRLSLLVTRLFLLSLSLCSQCIVKDTLSYSDRLGSYLEKLVIGNELKAVLE